MLAVENVINLIFWVHIFNIIITIDNFKNLDFKSSMKKVTLINVFKV